MSIGGTIPKPEPGSRAQTQLHGRIAAPENDLYRDAYHPGTAINGLHFDTANFGAYMPDSQAQENVRDFYETLDAVGNATAHSSTAVQRVAPISEREIDLVRQAKEANLKMKNDQYWTSQINPALPWTLTEVTKVRPDILEKRLNAIKQLSQYTLDYEILRHLGHGGDPRLAELQYMIDQGQMDHMPKSTVVERAATKFRHGNLSLWNILTAGTDSSVADGGKFADSRLYLARSGVDATYDGDKQANRPYMQPRFTRSLAQTFGQMARPQPILGVAPIP
jgi:hypothetical protein